MGSNGGGGGRAGGGRGLVGAGATLPRTGLTPEGLAVLRGRVATAVALAVPQRTRNLVVRDGTFEVSVRGQHTPQQVQAVRQRVGDAVADVAGEAGVYEVEAMTRGYRLRGSYQMAPLVRERMNTLGREGRR